MPNRSRFDEVLLYAMLAIAFAMVIGATHDAAHEQQAQAQYDMLFRATYPVWTAPDVRVNRAREAR